MPKESFFQNRIRSVGHAFRGAWFLLRTEASIQIQAVIALGMTIAGFLFGISLNEWILQTFAIALVMGVEGANTAIEKMADYVQPEFDPKIGLIKDISAGAVMLVSIGAIIVGGLIYIPRLIGTV